MSSREAVELPESLAEFVEMATVRLRGLHPAARVCVANKCVWVEDGDEAAAKAAAGTLLHLLYQERIYANGQAVRHALFAKLLGS